MKVFVNPITILLWLLFLSVPGAFSREIQNGLSDDQTKTLNSIKQIDDYPLYIMTYYGDYGFDEFLKEGHTDIAAAKALILEGCSCFTASNPKGDKIYGRNNDPNQENNIFVLSEKIILN